MRYILSLSFDAKETANADTLLSHLMRYIRVVTFERAE